MVQGERHLDPVNALLAIEKDPAGVVDQHIQARCALSNLIGEAADVGLRREVGGQPLD